MLPAACLSAFACAVAVFPLAYPGDVSDAGPDPACTVRNDAVWPWPALLTIGSRLVSATRASLLGNLELPFAPLWVWLAFGEVPSGLTLVGGGIVLAAVLLDLLADQTR